MLSKTNKGALLAVVLTITTMTGLSQQPVSKPQSTVTNDFALVANFEMGQVAQNGGGHFWLKGAGIDDAITFFHGLGIAGTLEGGAASNIQNNVSLDKVAVMGGPRYTTSLARLTHGKAQRHGLNTYGEALFGTAHGFNSVFPGTGGTLTRANAFSMQLGGGLNVSLKGGLGVRALEVDWVRTTLPNNGSNEQNDLRLGFGISYRR